MVIALFGEYINTAALNIKSVEHIAIKIRITATTNVPALFFMLAPLIIQKHRSQSDYRYQPTTFPFLK